MSDKQLKPCPFCGGKAEIAGEARPLQFVTCTGCDVCTRYRTLSEAINHWNTRAVVIDAVTSRKDCDRYEKCEEGRIECHCLADGIK